MTISVFSINNVDYNSYATIQEADNYLMIDSRYSAAWGALESEGKQINLIFASRIIDRLSFKGSKTSESQPLQFPRDGSNDIPAGVEEACILLAGMFALRPPVDAAQVPANIRSSRTGSVEYTFFRNISINNAPSIPSHIMDLISHLMETGDKCISLPRPITSDGQPARNPSYRDRLA